MSSADAALPPPAGGAEARLKDQQRRPPSSPSRRGGWLEAVPEFQGTQPRISRSLSLGPLKLRQCPSCGSGPAQLVLEAVQSEKCCHEAEVAGTADGAAGPALGVLTSSPRHAPTPGDDSRANFRAVGSSSARRRRRVGGGS